MKTPETSAALVSVTDKTGLNALAKALHDKGVHILASSGTKAFLESNGVHAEEVSAYTDSPEILGGRVKTLHPRIHGGILADRDDAEHVRTLESQGARPIDYVVVNLYPFEEKLRSGLGPVELMEFIDIGGIALVRAAAKNHRHVTVLTSPSQYGEVIDELKRSGSTSPALRVKLAAEAFARTAAYDAAISRFMRGLSPAEGFPERLAIGLEKVTDVRYGENPHQRGALYRTSADSPIVAMRQLQGKELSFNNYLDSIGAFALVQDLPARSVVIIKHNNPCGVGWCGEVVDSFRRALRTDSTSAFGGVVAVNGEITAALADEMGQLFLEVVVARSVDAKAAAVFEKKKNLRVATIPDAHWDQPRPGITGVLTHDVMLVEDEDAAFPELDHLEVVTRRRPTEEELLALKMAWKVAKHVKSNAIVIADDQGTVGIGAGQMSRVDSSQIATRKAFDAGLSLRGTAAASDAFFPFADGVTELARAGVAAIIQPGGSIRDREVIDAADAANVAMLFTGRRHFRHL